MRKKIVLTPEELYYMGTLLQAKYIDYAYVAAMGDIQQKREIYESTTKSSLTEKGVLLEDFSGNMEVDLEVRKLLEPIFFGDLESSIDVVSVDGEERKKTLGRKFHFYEGQVTATEMLAGEIQIEAADDGKLQAWIAELLSADYAAEEEVLSAKAIDKKNVSRIIAVKSNKVGVRAAVNIYIECDGKILKEKEDFKAQVLTKEQFGLEMYRGTKGE